ncbi:MAG TPA: PilN domain-containing protein [Kofleriaceae bacterium]|nr:PilN domain-containing protein [Kofleriaceae bacterium]
MIRINLLGQRKARRRHVAAVSGPTTAAPILLILIAAVAALGVAGLFLLHRPLARHIDELQGKTRSLQGQNDALKRKTENSRATRTAFEAALERQQATSRLKQARVSPAWLMRELSNVLTPGRQPQLTPEMQEEMKTNPNRPWQDGWDPKHVWITSFDEKGGNFRLQGGAQSRSDIDELGLRLRASMFFGHRLKPASTGDVTDRDSGLTYYNFTIEGIVRY